MSIPTTVVAAAGHLVLIEDIPNKPRIRIPAGQPTNLLDHYTLDEVKNSTGIQKSIVNGWLLDAGGVVSPPPSPVPEEQFGVKIPEGVLATKTLQRVSIRERKTETGTAVETVMDPEETAAVREKLAGVSSKVEVERDTEAVGEIVEDADAALVEDEDDTVSVSKYEKKEAAKAKARLRRKPRVITRGDFSKMKNQPVFSVSTFVEASETKKLQIIESGDLSEANLKAIRDRKINNGNYFSVRVRTAAREYLQSTGGA